MSNHDDGEFAIGDVAWFIGKADMTTRSYTGACYCISQERVAAIEHRREGVYYCGSGQSRQGCPAMAIFATQKDAQDEADRLNDYRVSAPIGGKV